MRTKAKNFNTFLLRAAFLLLLAVTTTLTAEAGQYVKDVMLIGGSSSEVSTLKTTYENQGWTVINQNLNEGTNGDQIFLLCKYGESNGVNFGYVADLYISTASGTAPDSRPVGDRTFYLVPYDGGSHFEEKKGDLNSNAGGADIHLYYTRTPDSNNSFLTSISFTNTSGSGTGALGTSGWGTGYDLNSDAGGKYIYLHATFYTATTYKVTIEPGIGLINNEPPSSRSSAEPGYIAASKAAAQNFQFYNDNGNIGFRLDPAYNPSASNQKDGYTFLGWNFGSSEGAYHALSQTQTTYTAQRYGWLHNGATITGVECSSYSIGAVTTATIPTTIDGTAITAINISDATDYSKTIRWSLPRLQTLYLPSIASVSGTPFAGCSYLTNLWFTTTKPMSFADGSLAGLSNQLFVACYKTPKPEGFRYQVYERSPNLVLYFNDGFCGWCGDTGTENGLCWTMRDDDLTIDCCDNRYETYPDAQIVNNHPWTNAYSSTLNDVHKVHLGHAVKGIAAEIFKDNVYLTDLYYEGTKAEWDAVTKGTNWKSGVASNFKEHWRCTVTFDANGRGTNPDVQANIWSNQLIERPFCTHEFYQGDDITEYVTGYDVAGWYTEAAYNTRWNFDTDLVLDDMTLYALWTEPIHDASDNDLTAWNGKTRDATLDGRILYMDDDWNTICLPFPLSSFDGTPLAGFTVMELNASTSYFYNGTLFLYFDNVTSIEAGKPYIVKKKATTNVSYNVISASDTFTSECLFDNNENTCWSDLSKPWFIEFSTSSPVWTTGYTITRFFGSNDPYIWTLQAKLNNGDSWVTIDRYYRYYYRYDYSYGEDFSIDQSKQGNYKYFRLVVEDTEKSFNSDYEFLQIAELSIQSSDRITSPLFRDITINADEPTAVTSDDGKVSFVGSYSPVSLTAGDKTVLYLGSNNKLFYPSTNRTLNSCRALFQLNGIVAGDVAAPNSVSACVLNFGDSETTGILNVNVNENDNENDNYWYSLDGKKLSEKPTQKGVYIHNGKKMVIK